MNIREFYKTHYLPLLLERDSKRSTLYDYRKSVDYWMEFLEDVMIEKVSRDHIRHYSECLKIQPGRRGGFMAQNTRRKHLKNIRSILTMAGPSTARCEEGVGLLKRVPKVHIPDEVKRNAKDFFRYDDLQALFRVLDQAQRPATADDPGLWWTAILHVFFYTAMRIGRVMAIHWEWVDLEHGTITVQKDGRDERVKGKDEIHYLTTDAVEALKKLKAASPESRPTDKVFPWPNWPNSQKSMYNEFYRLQEIAGIPKERRRSFHAIRKCMVTLLYRTDPGAAQKIAGHSSQLITMGYYAENEAVIRPALDKLPRLMDALKKDDTDTTPTAAPTSPINDYSDLCASSVVIW